MMCLFFPFTDLVQFWYNVSEDKLMKKWIISALVISMLAGCGQKKNEEPEETATPEPVEEVQGAWVKKPGELNIDAVKDMDAFDQVEIAYEGGTVLGDEERIGMPQEWYETGYENNAVVIEKDGKHGVYDYNGNQLFVPTVNVHSTPFARGITMAKVKNAEGNWVYAYGYCNSTISSAVVFTPDFTAVTDVPFADYQFAPYSDTSAMPYFAIVDGTFGVLTPGKNEDGSASGSYSFAPYSGTGLTRNMIVPVLDPMYKTVSRVVVFQNGSIGPNVLEDLGTYQTASYANGYYRLKYSDTTIFIHAESATQIGWAYHDAKNFSSGYAPVKRYGYWALLNENGDEVTDYVFNDIMGVYNGKAYVRVGKQWGIINVGQAVERGRNLTWTALFGTEKSEPLGTLTVHVADLNFRTGPDPSYEAVGNSVPNSAYPVYETTEASGYTWYRIDENVWLPSEGTWATFEKGVLNADEGPDIPAR